MPTKVEVTIYENEHEQAYHEKEKLKEKRNKWIKMKNHRQMVNEINTGRQQSMLSFVTDLTGKATKKEVKRKKNYIRYKNNKEKKKKEKLEKWKKESELFYETFKHFAPKKDPPPQIPPKNHSSDKMEVDFEYEHDEDDFMKAFKK